MSEFYIKLRSNYLNSTVDLTLIMPNPFVGHNPRKFYSAGKKYPVLWLLHGGSDTLADWITYSTVARQAIWRNTIIVAPSVPNGDFINQPLVGEGYPFYDFFFNELTPFVYNWLPASEDPSQNFLAGNSMGCEATWRYGIQNPDFFGCIAPLGSAPCDYRYLEPYREMSGKEFRRFSGNGGVPSAYGPAGSAMTPREINNVAKYAKVGDFLDSSENTMARFAEAAAAGRLPRVYMTGSDGRRDPKLAAFKKHVEDLGLEGISFDLYDEPSYATAFWEKAVERFMDRVGLKNVERNVANAPIRSGVHDMDDDHCITLH